MQKDGFIILEYIRSSIEIIMSLKIEDLERDHPNGKKQLHMPSNLSSKVTPDHPHIESQKGGSLALGKETPDASNQAVIADSSSE
jgi:hypothetical protein